MLTPEGVNAGESAKDTVLLSPELLGRIFELALPKMDQSDRRAFQSFRCVSAQWRATALATPSLFARISVNIVGAKSLYSDRHTGFDRTRDADAEQCVARVAAWLARAGPSVPLEVEAFVAITENGYYGANILSAPATTRALAAVLAPLRHRIASLTVDAGVANVLALCKASLGDRKLLPGPNSAGPNPESESSEMLPPTVWSSLRSVKLCLLRHADLETPAQEPCAARMPVLREVTIEADRYGGTPSLAPLAVPSVSELCMRITSLDKLVQAQIACFHALTSLALIGEPAEWWGPREEDLILPTLRAFQVHIPTDALAYLKRLTFPALETLNVRLLAPTRCQNEEGKEEEAPFDVEAAGNGLRLFFAECGLTLRNVRVAGGEGRADVVRVVLAHLPSRLRRLHLEEWPYTGGGRRAEPSSDGTVDEKAGGDNIFDSEGERKLPQGQEIEPLFAINSLPSLRELVVDRVGAIGLGGVEGFHRTRSLLRFVEERVGWERVMLRQGPFILWFPSKEVDRLRGDGVNIQVLEPWKWI